MLEFKLTSQQLNIEYVPRKFKELQPKEVRTKCWNTRIQIDVSATEDRMSGRAKRFKLQEKSKQADCKQTVTSYAALTKKRATSHRRKREKQQGTHGRP